MDEAEANRVQTEWCRAEVARIQASGERYVNGRLAGTLSLSELRAIHRRSIYDIGRITRTVSPGRPQDAPRQANGRYAPVLAFSAEAV